MILNVLAVSVSPLMQMELLHNATKQMRWLVADSAVKHSTAEKDFGYVVWSYVTSHLHYPVQSWN